MIQCHVLGWYIVMGWYNVIGQQNGVRRTGRFFLLSGSVDRLGTEWAKPTVPLWFASPWGAIVQRIGHGPDTTMYISHCIIYQSHTCPCCYSIYRYRWSSGVASWGYQKRSFLYAVCTRTSAFAHEKVFSSRAPLFACRCSNEIKCWKKSRLYHFKKQTFP